MNERSYDCQGWLVIELDVNQYAARVLIARRLDACTLLSVAVMTITRLSPGSLLIEMALIHGSNPHIRPPSLDIHSYSGLGHDDSSRPIILLT